MPTSPKNPPPGSAERKPTCFLAMPITTRDDEAEFYNDPDHWDHVMESLFVKAVEAAGFQAIRPAAQGSHLIHGQIINHLSSADLVLCDLSRHNPNVFFELGVRTSLNLPVALVRDEDTPIPFDTSGINTHTYSSSLRGWEIEKEQERLSRHIKDCASSCAGQNPLWRHFGLTIRAKEPDAQESPLEAKVDLLTDRISMLHHMYARDKKSQEDEWRFAKTYSSREVTNDHQAVRAFDMENEVTSRPANLEQFISDAYDYLNLAGIPTAIDHIDGRDVTLGLLDGAKLSYKNHHTLQNIAQQNGINLNVIRRRSQSDSTLDDDQHPRRFTNNSKPRTI